MMNKEDSGLRQGEQQMIFRSRDEIIKVRERFVSEWMRCFCPLLLR